MSRIPILMSAGEASGDLYAARLASALRARADVELFGMGGDQMRAAGVEVVADYRQVAVVGITEIFRHLPSLMRAMRSLVREAERRKPRLAILTDFPGFHLRLARKLQSRGVRNVYYICPQFWAWRPWRANLIRRRFVKGLCIFPFEKEFFEGRGVATEFIGHPLVGYVKPALSRAEFAWQHRLDPAQPIITLLPGSRRSEISRHLPVMLQAVQRVRSSGRRGNVVVAAAPGVALKVLEELVPAGLNVALASNQTYDALAAADAAIVCSGTATVEAALLDAPLIVVYRLTAVTAALAKPLVRAKYYSMVNLIADRRLVPELVQEHFNAEELAMELSALLDPGSGRVAQIREGLAEVRARLGCPGAVERAADAIAALL
jgi:lipid-A-disaccharide synthase